MLRRRTKASKHQRHESPGPAPEQRSRRRGRGAEVPRELRVGTEKPARDRVVLVTGFDPFAGERTNPSWEICERLPESIAGLRVEKCRVPVEFRRAIEVVAAAIEHHRPELVVCIGQAGGRTHVSVERVAINVDDARAPDNGGAQPVDEPIARDGPPAYFATLPIKAMTAAMRAAGVPAEVSNSAGTYVCNHLMYGVLHFLAGTGSHTRAGFIHVPYSEEQVLEKAGVAAMSVASMASGIEAGIRAAAGRARDIVASEGAFS